jgi:prepilin-type processing-associated H-X9-DG protein
MPARRPAATLVELLVAVGLFAALFALLLPAVQRVRAAAARLACQSHLRQVALALHGRHDLDGRLPPGTRPNRPAEPRPAEAWHVGVLAFLEQEPLAAVVATGGRRPGDPFPRVRPGMDAAVRLLGCPADPRTAAPADVPDERFRVGLTSYLGNTGTSHRRPDGVLYLASRTRLTDIADGLSNTLLVGERPPSFDNRYGWWCYGVGQANTGSLDAHLGAREVNRSDRLPYVACPRREPYRFQPGGWADPCSAFHFWSLHPGGANFALADGSVRFLPYSAADVLPALATRAGGEAAGPPD